MVNLCGYCPLFEECRKWQEETGAGCLWADRFEAEQERVIKAPAPNALRGLRRASPAASAAYGGLPAASSAVR